MKQHKLANGVILVILAVMVILLGACSNFRITTTVMWEDNDGNVLNTEKLWFDQKPSEFQLPEDTDIWRYTGWKEEIDEGTITYIAERTPQESYFTGNVFQIISKDLNGNPITTGTGYVFNKQGWFITNSHVMDDAYNAAAIFEIKNDALGESFMSFDIEYASYNHYDKDIFIGKITNYNLISKFYREFAFTQAYEIGDKTYSIGYPNSSVELEINEGVITDELSSLYDKLYSGNSYIGSTSFVAPGSSGGILVNENLEILGITSRLKTDEDDQFEIGVSIETYNFYNLLQNTHSDDFEDLALFLHPEEKIFINFYRDFMNSDNVSFYEENGQINLTSKWESDEIDYYIKGSLTVRADKFLFLEINVYWPYDNQKTLQLYGYYSETEGINNFTYYFKYIWEDGDYFTVSSDKINYSSNVVFTLTDYESYVNSDYVLSEENITYAKVNFNYTYELLVNMLKDYE